MPDRTVPTPAIAALLAAACSSATPTEPVAVAFASADVRSLRAPAPVGVRADAGRLVVENVLGAPDPCQDVGAAGGRAGDRLELTVTARQRPGGACVAIVGAFAYRAELAGVPSGRYRLVVRHALSGGAARVVTALDTAVVVP